MASGDDAPPGGGDMFDAVTMLEDRVFSAGLASGEAAGAEAGFAEGEALGLQRGYEVGQELGFMLGVARAVRGALALPELAQRLGKHAGAAPSERLGRTVDKLEELILAYPRENLLDGFDPVSAMQKIRAKFLVVKMLATLSLKAVPPDPGEGISF
mmetsp:Transcript_31853/g.101343  ORF Transcript_31853/g.101343 Transcript_31853/m.101343 type:complete len:156 (-) Transcript_31853:364-831(-)|eukprot:CAMPEP_0118883784 /NCGR_PEP_ID=MMETSP1163-20130328/22792_1 /TAXON_ID=124430 /ORGANISM="Phaeomonas parva, Strain CCMP2877" /LENGTH=155 /DNA_ID=CAMNT_0006821331 /DNA_START=266 /DNA_END=733 /DNA_ORIENTATION=+